MQGENKNSLDNDKIVSWQLNHTKTNSPDCLSDTEIELPRDNSHLKWVMSAGVTLLFVIGIGFGNGFLDGSGAIILSGVVMLLCVLSFVYKNGSK